MSSRRKSFSGDESVSESDYLTTVMSLLNGYCKINLVIPQTDLFYSSDSLFPINAKINDTPLNNKVNKNQICDTSDSLVHNMVKNITDLKDDENVNHREFPSSNTSSNAELKIYSKPSYSDNSNNLGKKEENRRSVSPKGKKKRNKYNKIDVLSTLENQTLSSSNVSADQNISSDYFKQYENERSEDNLQNHQDQELQIKNVKNNINNHLSRSSANRSSENETENEHSTTHSQCPLCFLLYPIPDIEAHASECRL